MQMQQNQQPMDEGEMYINQRWEQLSNVNLNAGERKSRLAEILAISEMGARQRVKGIKNPVYDTNEYLALTNRILNDEAFNRLVDNGNDINIIRVSDTKKLVSGLARTVKEIKNEKRYDISDRQKLVQKRCKFIAGKMEATKKSKNDSDFEEVIDAVMDIADGVSKSPEEIKESVDIVKQYLSEKMPERNRSLSNERWGQCMMFLKETMPRSDFEEYCRSINIKRGVENKISSSKYISPEMFGYKKEPVRCIIAETKHRILSQRGTERDYASLIALRNRYDNVGFLDGDRTLENDNNRKSYVRETERILKSDEFKRFMKEIPEEQRQALLEGTCDGLLNYQNMLQPISRTNTMQQSQPQNRQSRPSAPRISS